MSNEIIDPIVAAFEKQQTVGIRKITPSRGPSAFRQVQVEGWPARMIHLEFITDKKSARVGTELHIEFDQSNVLRASIPILVEDVRRAIPEGEVLADPTWFERQGGARIRVLFPIDSSPELVARAMVHLIRVSRPRIDHALQSLEAHSAVTEDENSGPKVRNGAFQAGGPMRVRDQSIQSRTISLSIPDVTAHYSRAQQAADNARLAELSSQKQPRSIARDEAFALTALGITVAIVIASGNVIGPVLLCGAAVMLKLALTSGKEHRIAAVGVRVSIAIVAAVIGLVFLV